MAYLTFDKSKLINLEYSLSKEILRSNRAGSFCCTTIIGCNTRKYHGLLICPMEHLDGDRHVLLSTLDETVIQHGSEFNLGIHKYSGDNYFPKGHKYIRDYEAEVIGTTIFRVGGVIITKESLLVEKEEQILIRYTLNQAHSPTTLRLRPFLAFRNIHQLSEANMYANTKAEKTENGIKLRMYAGYPYLHLQMSKSAEFIHVPDWYYGIEYMREQERGYDYKEDLFVPGYFELPIKMGESVLFSASTKSSPSRSFNRKFNSEYAKRIPRDSFMNCLRNAAEQFIVRKEKRTDIIAGFPWFGTWGRDTFIALPGITLAVDDPKTCKIIIDSMIGTLENGLFPNTGFENVFVYNSVDAPLWFFSALQQYCKYVNTPEEIWSKYSKVLKGILSAFRSGTLFHIQMHDNGLIYAGEKGVALTWMDAVVDGKPVTPRTGYAVEINALWYNAIKFSLELAKAAHDTQFISKWKTLPETIRQSFTAMFWNESKGYLADVVSNESTDWSMRPNQIIAAGLPYSPLSTEIRKLVVDSVKKELLTPRGLRSLSPKSPLYKGVYEGNQTSRDNAYHQGTVWVWLLEFYANAYLDIYKASGVSHIKKIFDGFESEVSGHGIGTIAEIFDGDPPHASKGAISQAWSVSALLQIHKLIEKYENQLL